jgi:hypothetical protein
MPGILSMTFSSGCWLGMPSEEAASIAVVIGEKQQDDNDPGAVTASATSIVVSIQSDSVAGQGQKDDEPQNTASAGAIAKAEAGVASVVTSTSIVTSTVCSS